MVMIANLQYAWTMFVGPIQRDTGWNLAGIQWATTLFVVFQTWTQPAQGWLIDRLGPRVSISIAGTLCGAGWAALGFASSISMLYMSYSVAGIGAGLVYSGAVGLALKWFSTRRGLASGIMTAGFGGGTALFIPLIAAMIRTLGYRQTFIWTGTLQGLAIVVVAQFLRRAPADTRSVVVRTFDSSIPPHIGSDHFTPGEMLRSPQFYVLYAMFVMVATGGLLVTMNAGPIARDWRIGAGALTLATSLNAAANGASRIFWGWISDKAGRELTMATAFALHAACLFVVPIAGRTSEEFFVIALVLTFFTWGEIFSLFPSILGDYYGTRHATVNVSLLYTAKGVASIMGGGCAALLYQYSGTWVTGLYASAVMSAVASIIVLALRADSGHRVKVWRTVTQA